MSHIRRFIRQHTRELVIAAFAVASLGFLLLYKLGSLTHGLARSETPIVGSRATLHDTIHNPLNLPLSLLRLLISFTPYHGYTAARFPSAILGVLLLLVFIYIVRSWYGKRTAWYGAILLAVAPWYLHVSRLATSDILYPLGLALVLAYCSRLQRKPTVRMVLLGPILLSLLLYIPGFVWIVAFCVFWYQADFRTAWAGAPAKIKTLCLALWPLLLGLLGWAFYRAPSLVSTWLGTPENYPSPLHALRNFAALWLHIFIRGPQDPLLGLGYLPLLNVFASTMFIVGAYFYIKHWRAPRSRLLIALAFIGGVLAALQGPVSSMVVLPLVYILVAGGLGYLLNEWLKTFPRNPIARGLGYGLVAAAVVISSLYNLRQYFIAWPHNSTTKASFQRHL